MEFFFYIFFFCETNFARNLIYNYCFWWRSIPNEIKKKINKKCFVWSATKSITKYRNRIIHLSFSFFNGRFIWAFTHVRDTNRSAIHNGSFKMGHVSHWMKKNHTKCRHKKSKGFLIFMGLRINSKIKMEILSAQYEQ